MRGTTSVFAIFLWKSTVVLALNGYLLTGPKSLLCGSTETFCVSVEGIQTSVNYTLDLIGNEDKVIYASVNHRIHAPKDCFQLDVPAVVGETHARLRWRMQFDNYTVDNIKEIVLKQPETIHLIQSDKAWYTPNQLVRFRILSLNYLLYPHLDLVKRVWVEDPTGAIIAQWVNLTTSHGIFELQLQLSTEPVQGEWKIQMERGSHEKAVQYFEVREYVLPRFEVNVDGPRSIAFNEDNDNSVQKIQISVCAKYSFGQPLKGIWKANIKVSDNGRYYGWRHRVATSEINFNRSGSLVEETGCATLKLAGDQLGISLYDGSIRKTLQVFATVIELGTGIEMNNTWSTEIERQRLTVDFASWSSNTFKHGLPYYGKMKITKAGNQPAVNTTLELCVHPTFFQNEQLNREISGDIRYGGPKLKKKQRQNVTIASKNCSFRSTDINGFVSFEFLPSDPKVAEYTFKVSIPQRVRRRRRVLPFRPEPWMSSNVFETEFNIRSSYSPSNSFMVFVPPLNYPQNVECHSNLTVKLYFTAEKEEITFNVHYIVMARGDMLTGVKQVKFHEEDNIDLSLGDTFLNKRNNYSESESDVEASLKLVGDLEFDIEIVPEFSPKISLLAYYVRDDNEVVTAHIDIPVENCFPNPVKLSWSSSRKQPGQNVTVNLKSGAGSLCGYSVVDRSVTYARPDLQLSENIIYNMLPNFHIPAGSYPQQVTPNWKYCTDKRKSEMKPFEEDLRRRKRSFFPWNAPQLHDAMEAFDNAGLFVMSDLNIETRPCPERSFIYPLSLSRHAQITSTTSGEPKARMMTMKKDFVAETAIENHDVSYDNAPELKPTVSVRSYFPETWLWDLVSLNSKGEWKKVVTLPHTITTWMGRAICVSESEGFGMSSLVRIESFQPFFVELHLPYSMKRTEKLHLKISVFNYASHFLPIRLTLAYSEQFELLSDSDSTTLCVAAQSNVVHTFLIYAIEIGVHNVSVSATIADNFPNECGPEILPSASDNVVKELLVLPEGFAVERTYSHLSCPKDFDDDQALVWDLSLPEDVVEGSARAWVTAVGDLMGPALQGLSGLVRLPVGCGEQNMILFTPNIYVTQYLEATNQLADSIKSKAVDFMQKGYQRERNYRHSDGSYSAFGNNDPEGSLWLTAFVVKSFAAARRYIHIDESELQTSLRWLQSKQLENGCFPVIGTVLHKDLKGGLADSEDLSPLTAYALISLLEVYAQENQSLANSSTKSVKIDKLLENTLPCLNINELETPDLYTRSLTVYALALAGKLDAARRHLEWLMNRAQNNGSLLWWQKPESGPALNVEMTSYVLLSLVKLGRNEDLLRARSIVRWLSKQRNSEGGFVSTQDTVVALQAMSTYAAVIGTQKVDMEMHIKAGEFENHIRIQEFDRLVQRRVDLPLPTSEVSIDTVGEGHGCIVLQAVLRYNTHSPPPSNAFHLNVTTYPLENIPGLNACQYELVICSRFVDSKHQESNMALIEVGFVSGYQINKASLSKQKLEGVKRHELNEATLILYFDQISAHVDTCVSLVVQQIASVDNAKEANVKVFDYYESEHSRSVSYYLPNDCSSPKFVMPNSNKPPEKVIDDPLNFAEPLTTMLARKEGQEGPKEVVPANHPDPDKSYKDTKLSDFDLEVPDSSEAPVTTFALPGHTRGCPTCLSSTSENFIAQYCQSKPIYHAEIQQRRNLPSFRLRLKRRFSHQSNGTALKSVVDLLFEADCVCNFIPKDLEKRNVTVVGLPSLELPSLPAQLLVGSELLIIDTIIKQKTLSGICKGTSYRTVNN